MYLAKNLRYLRLKNGLSQNYLADKLGYKSYTTIQKWEMGISEPPLEVLSKLSKLYNVDMHTLYSVNLERVKKKPGFPRAYPLIVLFSFGCLLNQLMPKHCCSCNQNTLDCRINIKPYDSESCKDAYRQQYPGYSPILHFWGTLQKAP